MNSSLQDRGYGEDIKNFVYRISTTISKQNSTEIRLINKFLVWRNYNKFTSINAN